MNKSFLLKNIVFSLFLILSSCSSIVGKRSQLINPEDYNEKIRIACVGDSITYGAGIKDRQNFNYPLVLGKSLGERFDVRNFGVSGATMLKNGDYLSLIHISEPTRPY